MGSSVLLIDAARIRIHSSARAVEDDAFYNRAHLKLVIFTKGLRRSRSIRLEYART
jgi:hypothetical protein